MGRKSKTKKIVREILEEKAKKGRSSALFEKLSKPQSKKDFKKQISTHALKKAEKKPKKITQALVPVAPLKDKIHHRIGKHLHTHRRSIFGGLLAAIMIALLFCIAYLLFSKAFRPDPIAKYLPADSTVALLEFNTNFDHSQITRSFGLLEKYPQYSKQELIKKVETALSLSYESELKPWLGRSVSMVLFNRKEATVPGIAEAYFAEYLNEDELMKFITAHSTSEKRPFQNYEVFNLNKKYYATIIGQYLVVALDENTINELITAQAGNNQPLYSSEKYRQVEDSFPLNKVAFAYLDFTNIEDSFFERFPLLSEKGLTVNIIAPFVKIFDAEGAALIANEDNFILQSFSNLNSDSNASSLAVNTKNYSANLSSLVKKDAIVFWGAQDLSAQFRRLLTILSGGQDSVMVVFNKVINNYVKKYFGETVTLEEGILPLLEGEFAIAVEAGPEMLPVYKALFTLENGKVDALKLQDLAKQFASVGAIFAPKVVTHTLPDGTISREIIAVPEEIIGAQSSYKDTTIYSLKAGNQGWSVYYAFVDNNAVIATSMQSVKDSIDLYTNPDESLHSSAKFNSIIEPVLGFSSELSYFNIQSLLPLVLGKTPRPEILEILDTASSGKSYSSQGISTINYLHIK